MDIGTAHTCLGQGGKVKGVLGGGGVDVWTLVSECCAWVCIYIYTCVYVCGCILYKILFNYDKYIVEMRIWKPPGSIYQTLLSPIMWTFSSSYSIYETVYFAFVHVRVYVSHLYTNTSCVQLNLSEHSIWFTTCVYIFLACICSLYEQGSI